MLFVRQDAFGAGAQAVGQFAREGAPFGAGGQRPGQGSFRRMSGFPAPGRPTGRPPYLVSAPGDEKIGIAPADRKHPGHKTQVDARGSGGRVEQAGQLLLPPRPADGRAPQVPAERGQDSGPAGGGRMQPLQRPGPGRALRADRLGVRHAQNIVLFGIFHKDPSVHTFSHAMHSAVHPCTARPQPVHNLSHRTETPGSKKKQPIWCKMEKRILRP